MINTKNFVRSIRNGCLFTATSLALAGCGAANEPGASDSPLGSSSAELKGGRHNCGPTGRLVSPTVPAALIVPATATLVARYHATGTQNYVCSPSTATNADGGVTNVWTFKAPNATLYNEHCCVAGTHFAGPTWRSIDGSSVVGAKLASATSPNPDSIPILLLKAASNSGSGIFSNVTFIQRLDTLGGVAPTGPCEVQGAELDVPYEANYYFYAGGI